MGDVHPSHFTPTRTQRLRDRIAADVAAFEAKGGKIDQVPESKTALTANGTALWGNRDTLPENIRFCERKLVYQIRVKGKYTGSYNSVPEAIEALSGAVQAVKSAKPTKKPLGVSL